MANKLATYLQEARLSQRTFAGQVGVDNSVISRFARDEAKPGLELAVKIQRATNGAVPADSWIEDPAAPESQASEEDAA